jgi:hypothetical protein
MPAPNPPSSFLLEPRKVVGRPIEKLSLFDRMRRLSRSLEAMGLQQKKDDGGKHIRRTVGAACKK